MGSPNQYQRRQIRRRVKQLESISLLITMGVFCLAYLLLRDPVNNYQYQQVLNSNGALTLRQIQSEWFNQYAGWALVAFFVVWAVASLIVGVLTRRRPNNFDFDDAKHSSAKPSQNVQFDLSRINPRDFEKSVARLITQQTGYQAQVVGGTNDGGVDIKVYDANRRLIGVVQCKRYNPHKALPPMFVREMATVKQMHHVNIGYLATTTYFTEETRRLAAKLNVRLIDGQDLKHIINTTSSAPVNRSQSPAQQKHPDYTKTVEEYKHTINGMWDEPASPQ